MLLFPTLIVSQPGKLKGLGRYPKPRFIDIPGTLAHLFGMWKFCFPVAFAVLGVLSPLLADSVAHEYYDQAAWERAVSNWGPLLKANFNGTSISVPGISVASYIGYNGLHPGSGQFSAGVWTDSITKYGYTEWTFREPVYAFGAHFRMDVQDGLEFFSGLNLSMPNERLLARDNPPTRHFDGFYGFISTTPITKLMVSLGSNGPRCACRGQSYIMDNLEISTSPVKSAVPEPSIQ